MMKLLQLYLLHAEEHTVVLINKIKEQSLYIYTKTYGNYQRQVIIASQLEFTFGD